jgi:hypothetical protein
MEDSAARAQRDGRIRRRPARPGLIGGWFARSLGSPDKIKSKAPAAIRPRSSPPLADAAAGFFASQQEVREFLRRYSGIDLAGVTFPNPFITGIRFSLATGLHVIGAHERRHLIQARGVRDAARRAGS